MKPTPTLLLSLAFAYACAKMRETNERRLPPSVVVVADATGVALRNLDSRRRGVGRLPVMEGSGVGAVMVVAARRAGVMIMSLYAGG